MTDTTRRSSKRDEVTRLHQLGRIRNALLTAKTVEREVLLAAERVVRLSDPGTPERLLTTTTVAEDTGIDAGLIVRAIIRANRRLRKADAHD